MPYEESQLWLTAGMVQYLTNGLVFLMSFNASYRRTLSEFSLRLCNLVIDDKVINDLVYTNKLFRTP